MRSCCLAFVLGLSAALVAGADDKAAKENPKKENPKKVPPGLVQLLKGGADGFIRQFDKNKDGVLTKDELPPQMVERFDRIDANGDGKIDKAEVEKLMEMLKKRLAQGGDSASQRRGAGKMIENILERLDANKDGKISKEEAMGPLGQAFDKLDANKDGFLDKTELARFAARVGDGKGARPGESAGPPVRPGVPDFDALDKNADGRLTPDEVKGTPLADKFEQIDANKDGKIEPKEWKAFFSKQAEKKGEKKVE